ncbi:BPSL0761 family protein [Pseudomonas sp. LF090]
MPSERPRSLIQAQDFLVDLCSEEAVSESFRTQARRLLRHYQSSIEIMPAGKIDELRNRLSDCAIPEFHNRVVGHIAHFSKSRTDG